MALFAQQQLLDDLESLGPNEHELMREAAEYTFDILGHLGVNYEQFYEHVCDYIDLALSVAEMDKSCNTEMKFNQALFHWVLSSELPSSKPVPPLRTSSKRSRAAEFHNLSEKRRRSRINEKMKALQNLIPNSNKPYGKSSLKAIEKAIVNSDVGMTPNNDGEVIRLSVSQLTSDRRKELSKIVA
ncbi:hypothetical protein RIF29_40392 [Crotalaria pallida]|uniref:BHLH domain-containing protein n=1 Tax=Crotalaria pallida TaxID=3830 RepID=A0AAN9E8H9_CROPI